MSVVSSEHSCTQHAIVSLSRHSFVKYISWNSVSGPKFPAWDDSVMLAASPARPPSGPAFASADILENHCKNQKVGSLLDPSPVMIPKISNSEFVHQSAYITLVISSIFVYRSSTSIKMTLKCPKMTSEQPGSLFLALLAENGIFGMLINGSFFKID